MVIFAVQVSNALAEVSQAQSDLDSVIRTVENKSATELTIEDYDKVDTLLLSLNQSLTRTDSLTRIFRPAAAFSTSLDTQFRTLDAAIATTQATRLFLRGMRPTISLLERGGVVIGDTSTPRTTPGDYCTT